MGERVSPERQAFAALWIHFKSVCSVNGWGFWGLEHRGDFRTTCAALGAVYTPAAQNRLAACIGKDLIIARNILAPRAGNYTSLGE